MPVKQEFVCLVPGFGKRCGNAGAYKNHLVSGKKNKILRFTRKIYRTFQKDDATRYQTQLRKTVGGGDYCNWLICELDCMGLLYVDD